MKRLIAKRAVLYGARMYQPGDTLPAGDAKMVAAWLRADSAAWNGPETPQGDQNGPETPGTDHGGALVLNTVKLVDGHLDPEQLATMKKADLADLADKLGVDISAAKNNAERAALIAAVTVQAPADENGGAQ
uniref:Mu-like prophage FluMu N-terminal domain-containing protein n=1 Tax=Dulem virus 34 TaxID=3145752 RepID=A0AAU8B5Q8_9CAUD